MDEGDDTNFQISVRKDASDEVQLEAIRATHSIQRWRAAKDIVIALATATVLSVSCIAVCGGWG